MRKFLNSVSLSGMWGAFLLLIFVFPLLGFAQEDFASAEGPVDPEVLKLKIAEVEASSTLDEQVTTTLVELYRRALTNLEQARVERASADEFAESAASGPEELDRLQKETEKLRKDTPEEILRIPAGTRQSGLEQFLSDEKAALAGAEERLATLRARYTSEVSRPALARQRLDEARSERDAATSEIGVPPAIGETGEIAEARNWRFATRAWRLSAEIHKLEQELLTHDTRLKKLEAQRDLVVLQAEHARMRIRNLEEIISGQRSAEAEQARREAVAAREELVSTHVLVSTLAADNVELGNRLKQRNLDIQSSYEQRDITSQQLARLDEELSSAEAKLAIAGLNKALGQLFVEQRRALPNHRALLRQTRERERLAADVGLEQIELGEQRRELRDIDAYVGKRIADLPALEAESVRKELKSLAENQLELVQQSIDSGARYLRVLGELDQVHRQLTDTAQEYRKFLDGVLLWVRNTSPIRFGVFLSIPDDFGRLLSAANWGQFLNDFVAALYDKYLLVLLLAVALFLGLLRQRSLEKIDKCSRHVGRIAQDRFSYSILALIFTFLAAAPLPIVVGLLGLTVTSNVASAPFSSSIGTAMMLVAVDLLIIQFFLDTCRDKGLLKVHCGWTENTVDKLRRELRWFLFVFPAARLVGDASFLLDSGGPIGGLSVLGTVASAATLGILLFRLFTPAGGILNSYLQQHPRGLLAQTRPVWLTAIEAVLPLLIILWLSGYNYTGDVLAVSFMYSFWLLLWLMVLQSLLTRWLVLGYQRLELNAAIDRRDAARAERHSAKDARGENRPIDETEFEMDETQVDFAQLCSNSRHLLTTVLIFVALAWLWLIWAPILPALGVFDAIALWTRSSTVNGELVQVPVTLANVLFAVIIGIATGAAARGLPALVELVLLQRTRMTTGGRYTATTLLRYAIIGAGSIIVIGMLGISWSKAQWLVAALGVGIGFGLQEIVANFISGLVILFERPIRVGDTVTVGDTSGVVTRIQIRATTIRDWDHRELLVPNKEFITGRLLNWSLSDEIVRLVIPVGVAYGSDVALAMKLAEQAALEHEQVLEDPGPSILFTDFGDNALNLSLRVYLPSIDHRLSTQSELNQSINRKFAEAGIKIAFPQRDVHLDTKQPLEIRVRPTEDGTGFE